jgi:hypothetical protein
MISLATRRLKQAWVSCWAGCLDSNQEVSRVGDYVPTVD